MTSLQQDIRYTLRQLRRAPVFSLAVVGTVALAVGATAAMCGILRATLLHPLPYPHPEQLVEAGDQNLRGFKANGLTSVLRTEDLAHLTANGQPLLSSLGFFYSDDSTLTVDGQTPLRIPATGVSGAFFSTLAAPALLGRTLTPADDIPNGPQLVILSYHLWQTTFAGDPHVVGRIVRLGTDQATVVGVMPPHFDLPAGTDLWHPGHIFPRFSGSYRGDGSRFLQVIARVDPSVTIQSLRAATTQLAGRLAATYPETDAAWGFTITDLRTGLFGEYRQVLLLLAAAVALVLLAAAVNIAGLQLSRNAARRGEFAVRTALGITRGRLARLLAVEALTPVLAGGLVGIALAMVVLRVVVSRLPPALVLIDRPRIDLPVFAISLAVAVAVGLLTVAAPILQNTAIRHATFDRTVLGRTRTLGRGLSALQIALALVLLTLSAAVLLNLYRLLTTPLSFDLSRVQTFSVDLPWGADPAKSHRLYSRLEDTFSNLPGIESAGSITALPLSNFSLRRHFDIAGQSPTANHDTIVAEANTFSPGYLHTLRIPLLAGRTFQARDFEPNAPRVLVVNRTLADRYFHGTDAIGKHLQTSSADLHIAPGSDKDLVDAGEIVGITGDIRGSGGPLDRAVQPEIYSPEDGGWPHMQFALRWAPQTSVGSSTADAVPDPAFQAHIRSVVTTLDSTASPGHFTTLSTTRDRSLTEPRLNAALLSAFAGLALLLVVIGVYGLVAFDVAQRTRELGLRIALGSSRGGVLRLLLFESGRVLAIGLAAGLAGSWLANRLLSAIFFGTPAQIPALILSTAVLVSAAVLIATLVPARRAAAIDPMQALRSE